jgi:23S rRNA pseudouridine2605 synthase
MHTGRTGLARALSKSGHCSRSAAVEKIRAGKVKLNGRVVRDPEKPVHLGRDNIRVEGDLLPALPKLYFVLNKPRGFVTTASDEKGRRTVYELLPADSAWVAPVGRLDMASEGLLLMTNDSEWSARIADPSSHVEKVYQVQVTGMVSKEMMNAMLQGVRRQNQLLKAKRIHIVRQGQRNTWLQIVLAEGKNRQIRRMVESFGREVLRLIRISIGPLTLGDLPKGSFRPLAYAEKSALDRAMAPGRR